MDVESFHYRPACSAPHCPEPALYKVAAEWSDGTSRELKNYGLACEAHGEEVLAEARSRRGRLTLAEGEVVAQVQLWRLVPGARDLELSEA